MKEEHKKNILKIAFNYLIFTMLLILMVVCYKVATREEFVFKGYPTKVQELNRFEFEGDTLIVLRVEYQGKDYITTKTKTKK